MGLKGTLTIVLANSVAVCLIAHGTLAQSASSSVVVSRDVLSALQEAPPELRGRACKPIQTPFSWLEIPPIQKISGLNSRQDNVDSVKNARPLENFAQAFSAYSVQALATDDTALKERLIKILAVWANNGALLKTNSCVSKGRLQMKGACAEWKDPDGRDLTAMKDATFTTFIGAGLVRSYYAALADFKENEFASEHKVIRKWIAGWAQRLKTPSDVYFGLNMGWYWPSIINDMAVGKRREATRKLKRLEKGLIRLVDKEGAIADRTTRGDRALWYHYTSIGEIVMSMELMRAAGLTPSEKLEGRLHSAVRLFLRAVDDHQVLDKWARTRHNSRYNGKQDWSYNWPDNNFGGTWMHVYPYRYPDNPNSAALKAKVKETARSAVADIDLGIGLGCIYNIAASTRD